MDQRLSDLSLGRFADRLADRTPTPGGGSVAAELVVLGSALVSMAFRFTSGEKYAAVERAMAGRVEELDRLRARALELVDEDTDAYDAVTAAYRLPKSSDAEKASRTAAIQVAVRGALEVPSETMRTALAGLRLAAAGARDINPNLASDCATGAWCLWSAAESALLNVRINAASLQNKDLARGRRAECEAWRGEASELAEVVRAAVDEKLA